MRVGGPSLRQWTLPLALGFSDGILNALVLTATAILKGGGITPGVALRVGCVAFVTAVMTMFISDYSERRSRLSRSTTQLNLSESGGLASTRLGRVIQRESVCAALIASSSSFLGAVVPLLVAGAVPSASWSGLVVALLLLGALGVVLAISVDGIRWRWAVSLIITGVIVAAVESQLNIT